MPARLLIDTFSFQPQLLESGGNKRIVARGQFGRPDVPTQNRRVYPESILRREFNRLAEGMSRRSVFGELDHPEDGKTKLQRVSHLITNLRIEDGVIIGEAEILDTPFGKVLQALAQAGARIGVSSRGYGSTTSDADGNDVVGEDFQLMTFDFVADPAAAGSYPKIFAESLEQAQKTPESEVAKVLGEEAVRLIEESNQKIDKVLTESTAPVVQAVTYTQAQLDEAIQKARKEAVEQLKLEMPTQILESMVSFRAQVEEDVREGLLADPKVAGAKTVLEQVAGLLRPWMAPGSFEKLVAEEQQKNAALQLKLTESETARTKIEGDLREALELGRRAAINARLVSLFEGYENRDTLMELMSDRIVRAQTMEEVDTLALALAKDVGKEKRVVGADLYKSRTDEFGKLSEEVERLRKENESAKAVIAKAMPQLEEYARSQERLRAAADDVKRYQQIAEDAERRMGDVVNLSRQLGERYERLKTFASRVPQGATMVTLIESGARTEEVDRRLAESARQGHDVNEIEQARARARRSQGRDPGEDTTGRPTSAPTQTESFGLPDGTQIVLNEFYALAGEGKVLTG